MKRDVLLNVVASCLTTFVVQLVCYPLLASMLDSEGYGRLLLLMGVSNLVSGFLAVSLNNGRLLSQEVYPSGRGYADGDFNAMLSALQIFGGIAVFAATLVVTESLFESILLALITITTMFCSYHGVSFRLVIDYRRVLIMSVVQARGYLLGLFGCRVTGVWEAVFLCGQLFGCAYLFATASTVREPFDLTPRLGRAMRDYTALSLANLASSLTQYADRLLLYPILGSSSVSYYTVASYLGKTSGVVAGPISSVLLTYYSKERRGVARVDVIKRLAVMALLLGMLYVAVVLLAGPLLSFFYPTLAGDSLPYVPLASGAAVLAIYSGFVWPMVLSYAPRHWQPFIQVGYLVAYVLLALVGCQIWGLWGFCFGAVIAGAFRLVVSLIAVMSSLK